MNFINLFRKKDHKKIVLVSTSKPKNQQIYDIIKDFTTLEIKQISSIHLNEIIKECSYNKSNKMIYKTGYRGCSIFKCEKDIIIPIAKYYNTIIIIVNFCDNYQYLMEDFENYIPKKIRDKCIFVVWEKMDPDSLSLEQLRNLLI